MKFIVHKRIDNKRGEPLSRLTKAALGTAAISMSVLFWLAAIVACYDGEYSAAILIIGSWLFLVVLISLFYYMQLSQYAGKLELNQNGICFQGLHYQYKTVGWIYVGYCPPKFTISYQNHYYTKEQWAQMYGQYYIIVLDKNMNMLFACTYQKEVWDLLFQRTEGRLTTEECYLSYLDTCRKQKEKLENEAFCKHRGNRIINNYNGIIN